MKRRALRLIPLILVAATAVSALGAPSAHSAPLDDKKAQAKQLEQQITDNGRRIDALNEQINSAQIALDGANAAIVTADAQVAAATQKTKQLRAELGERAAALYRGSAVTGGVAILDARNALELNSRKQYTGVAAQREQQLVNQLARAKEELAARKADAEQARNIASAKKDEIQQTKSDLAAGDSKQRALLGQVNGEIAQLVAQQELERQQRDQAAAQARLVAAQTAAPATTATRSTGTTGTSGGGSTNTINATTPIPAPSGGASQAIAYAQAQLGKPYCYAGVGPACYDCSGLTMMAWGSAGVSMPHGSTEQWNMFPHLPVSQAQPGDLIVWDGHVGLYIGGGMMIHAPHTGDVVKVAPLYGTPWGAARPG
jgi:cell wall-associated NlpC family hydrolase